MYRTKKIAIRHFFHLRFWLLGQLKMSLHLGQNSLYEPKPGSSDNPTFKEQKENQNIMDHNYKLSSPQGNFM
jgi:hypothetical protein